MLISCERAGDGIGIPDHQREAVFAAFTRADGSAGYPGTGLGLAIVHRIVERHGGTIGVTAGRDEGSWFWLTIPVGPADVNADPIRTEEGTPEKV